MKRMGKVLLTVLVLMLTCFLVIGAGSSEVKAKSKPGKKLIMILVDRDTGQIDSIILAGEGNAPPQNGSPVPEPHPNFEFISNILFYKANPNCFVVVVGGYPKQVCW